MQRKIRAMSAGRLSVPLVLRMPGGGGQQLAATHSQNLEVLYAHIPGLKVVAPATPAAVAGLLRSAIRDDDPVVFIENLGLYNTKGEVPAEVAPSALGKASVLRVGSDCTVVSYSRGTVIALSVAERMATRA